MMSASAATQTGDDEKKSVAATMPALRASMIGAKKNVGRRNG